eukprot:GHVS01038259.1.p1 GENE.GHVS01038259.1~~GHVS01038259.1.p1  ORF type:complete len:372 (+),score=49.24 GHVS01038259.1:194-1309(+)
MECVSDQSPTGVAVAAVALYCKTTPSPPSLNLACIDGRTSKALGITKVPLLVTFESADKDAVTTDPVDIIASLAAAGGGKQDAETEKLIRLCAETNFSVSEMRGLLIMETLLSSRKFIGCASLNAADIVVYCSASHLFEKQSAEEKTEYPNINRWIKDMHQSRGLSSIVEQARSGNLNVEKKDGNNKKGNRPASNGTASEPIRDVADVTRLEIRVGHILKAWEHPEAEKLYCESIDIGEAEPRSIASGLRAHLKKEQLENHKVLILANMKSKSLRGFQSHGMVLCVSNEDNSSIELLRPPADAPVGELVMVEGLTGEPDPVMNTKSGKDPFIAVKDDLKTDSQRVAFFKSHKFMTSKGACFCDTICNGSIS